MSLGLLDRRRLFSALSLLFLNLFLIDAFFVGSLSVSDELSSLLLTGLALMLFLSMLRELPDIPVLRRGFSSVMASMKGLDLAFGVFVRRIFSAGLSTSSFIFVTKF